MKNLYVGNLAFETTEADLKSVFAQHGQVTSVKIASDRRGRTKRFAYVVMADDEDAVNALAHLRGTDLNGRVMDVVSEEPARSRRPFSRPGTRRRR